MNHKSVVAGNQSNGSAGTKACDNLGKTRVETVHDKDYILLPLWTQDPPFSSSKDSPGAGLKPSGEEEKKDAEDLGNEDSEVPTDNAAGIEDNAIDENIVYGCADDPNMTDLEEIGRFNERGIVIKNKAILVAQRYTQEDGINYDEVFAPVARVEAIRLFLAYALFKDFMVYQMDVKSAFLYDKIEEEAYVCQPPSFEDLDFPDRRGMINKTLFIKRDKSDILLVQVYVDDIIFGSTRKEICTEYKKMMHKKFHMSSIEELTFFLRLIFRYLKGQPKLGLWYPKDSPFDLVTYTNSDYARASLDRKSTTGGCQFLGCMLISWLCKKQIAVANSTTEAEYVTKIHIDNESTICIVKNLVFHSKTKHIEIRHHLNRDSNEKKLIQMIKIHTDKNVADLLTKAFDVQLNDVGGYYKGEEYQWRGTTTCQGGWKSFLKHQSGENFSLEMKEVLIVYPMKLSLNNLHSWEAHPTPIITQPSSSQPSRKQKLRKIRRQDIELPQTSVPTKTVVDEAVNEEMYDSLERATTTATGLDAEQDRGNISKTQFKATPNEPSSPRTNSGGGPKRQDIMRVTIAQTRNNKDCSKKEKIVTGYPNGLMKLKAELIHDPILEFNPIVTSNYFHPKSIHCQSLLYPSNLIVECPAHNVLTGLAVLRVTAAFENFCLAPLTDFMPDFINTTLGTMFLLGQGPSDRFHVPAVLIPGCHALPCKMSYLVAVETLHLVLVKPNSFFFGHVQLPYSKAINKVLLAFNSALFCAFSLTLVGGITVSLPSTVFVTMDALPFSMISHRV
nr:hypothetical protein [Tanacetum cinerariifolium]